MTEESKAPRIIRGDPTTYSKVAEEECYSVVTLRMSYDQVEVVPDAPVEFTYLGGLEPGQLPNYLKEVAREVRRHGYEGITAYDFWRTLNMPNPLNQAARNYRCGEHDTGATAHPRPQRREPSFPRRHGRYRWCTSFSTCPTACTQALAEVVTVWHDLKDHDYSQNLFR